MPLQQIPESSAKSYRTQQRLTGAAVLAGRRAWAGVDPEFISESWHEQAAPLAVVLTRLQSEAALDGARSVPAALADQGVEVEPEYAVRPRSVGGFAGAGYDPVTVFETAPIVAKARIGAGVEPAAALVAGGKALSGILQTAMADAGRQGQMLAIHSRPRVGYVRMLNPPSCSRCAILAGKASKREPFRRHPRCDCRAIPGLDGWEQDLTMNTGEYFESLTGEDQDRIFTKAGAQAIRDGADINQVVNARRGMKPMQTPGGRALVTNESMTRRGFGSRSMRASGLADEFTTRDGSRYWRPSTPRLMPETIYQMAGDNTGEAKRLLKAYGYI